MSVLTTFFLKGQNVLNDFKTVGSLLIKTAILKSVEHCSEFILIPAYLFGKSISFLGHNGTQKEMRSVEESSFPCAKLTQTGIVPLRTWNRVCLCSVHIYPLRNVTVVAQVSFI